jgi:hypothetical protein
MEDQASGQERKSLSGELPRQKWHELSGPVDCPVTPHKNRQDLKGLLDLGESGHAPGLEKRLALFHALLIPAEADEDRLLRTTSIAPDGARKLTRFPLEGQHGKGLRRKDQVGVLPDANDSSLPEHPVHEAIFRGHGQRCGAERSDGPWEQERRALLAGLSGLGWGDQDLNQGVGMDVFPGGRLHLLGGNRWEMPVIPGRSFREPAWYQVHTVSTGAA